MDVIQMFYQFFVDLLAVLFNFYTRLGAWGYVAVACFITALDRFVLSRIFGGGESVETASTSVGRAIGRTQKSGKYQKSRGGKYT